MKRLVVDATLTRMTLLDDVPIAPSALPESGPCRGRPGGEILRRERLGVAALTVAALALRLVRLGHQSLWMDESLEVLIASMASPLKMVHAVASGLDKNPPLYHLVMWGWLHLGTRAGAAYVRLPSVLASASLVPATWALSKRLAFRARWVAAALMAVSPFGVYYGQEARMYALAGALAAWSVVAFLRAFDRPERTAPWAAYAVLRVLAAYTHPYTLALNLPELVVAARAGRLPRRRAVASMAVQALSFLPWLSVLWGLRHSSAGFSKPLSPLAFGYTGFAFLFGYSLGPSLAQLHQGFSAAEVVPVALPGALAVAAAVVAWARRGSRRALLSGYIATSVVGAFFVASVTHVTFNVRYVIAALPMALIIVADGLVALRRRAVQVASGLVLGILTVVSLANWWTNPTYAKEDFRDATSFLIRHYTVGDRVVLVSSPEPFVLYSANRVPFVTLYHDGGRDSAAWDRLRHEGLASGTVWVVRARPWEADPDNAVLTWILGQGRLVGSYHAPGVDVNRVVISTPDPERSPEPALG